MSHEQLKEVFFERLFDMLTDPASARIFSEDDRRQVERRGKVNRKIGLFLGAFHAACDDLRIPRDGRAELEDEFFEDA